jgi:nitrite reductase/ring-hydroxylating ferredoxin subunit
LFSLVCKTSEIQEGELYRFDIGDKALLVTKISDMFYVTDSTCTHQEADLSLGLFFDGVVTCPLHGAKFDVKSGDVLRGPDDGPPESIPKLRVYETKIMNDELLADL